MTSRKKRSTGKDGNARKFLMQQKRKRDRGNACALLLASNSQIAKEYAERGAAEEADHLLHCVCEMEEEEEGMIPAHTWDSTSPGELSPLDWKNVMRTSNSYEEHEAHMSEIQLMRIVDKMSQEPSAQGTDGDEVMTKDGQTFSKFSKEALEIGASVSAAILKKVRNVFDLNKGDNEVFRTKNGAPKIMTKFKDKPYSYELLPEYANGSKKFPTVKSMN